MSDLLLRGGSVLVARGVLHVSDVEVSGAVVTGVGVCDARAGTDVVDCSGLLLVPGYLDLQVNGAHGVDLTADPDGLAEVAQALPRYGVTGFLPTLVSHPVGTVDQARASWRGRRTAPRPGAARALGWHIEGPFLSPERHGAHAPEHLRDATLQEVADWSPADGVAMVTVAPERAGALEVVRALAARGVVVSLGHTSAPTATVRAAVDAGATAVTHLFNAMPGLGHREPGLVGVALDDERLVCGVICDGIHVDPLVLRLAWRLLGPERWLTVTDCTAALGLPAGWTKLGSRDVDHGGDGVRLADGTLAGSAIALDDAVRSLVVLAGAEPLQAIATATATPARLLGLPPRDAIRAGAAADVTLLDSDLRAVATVIDGVLHWRNEEG